MKVTFFGVRGSIPTPGPTTIKYGGNTACTYVKVENTHIILDSGTGIRALGGQLIGSSCPVYLLLSHNHWDHIQGFPFFAPIYQPGRDIHIYPGMTKESQPEAILDQMTGSLFPVNRDMLGANIQIHHLEPECDSWMIDDLKVSRLKMNHPGGGCSYRIDGKGKSVVYMTDNELYPPYEKATDFLHFVDFAKDADLLIHDAQYLISDMPAKSGWGHSVAEEAVKLAMASNAKQLALYSHDPTRTDDDIDLIIEDASRICEIGGIDINCFGAQEGQSLDL